MRAKIWLLACIAIVTEGLTHVSEAHDDVLPARHARGWKDNTMYVWGKRSLKDDSPETLLSVEDDDGLSNKFQNFDIRNGLAQEDQKEKEKTKRKWGSNNLQVWGKRFGNSGEEPISLNDISSDIDDNDAKRKWGENSVAVWGKRNKLNSADFATEDKRKWDRNTMSVWGKRYYSSPDEEKRKWGENSMAVWGKRAQKTLNLLTPEDKRKWGENNMAVWGKKRNQPISSASKELEKRAWSNNRMSVWGKRDDNMSEKNYLLETHLIQLKDNQNENRSFNNDYELINKNSITNGGKSHLITKRSLLENDELPIYRPHPSPGVWRTLLSQNRGREGPKRNWETNTMRVWGKRDGRSLWSNNQ